MDRPALRRLMADIEAGKIDIIVVYKIDRLSRSLADFARMVEFFDRHRVSFSAVTQQINSATSMGRLMLNVLLSFAQFEREVTSERIRDKSRRQQGQGNVDGRAGATWLRRAQSHARRQRGRGGSGAPRLRRLREHACTPDGESLAPTHTVKKGKTYRYYAPIKHQRFGA